MRWIQTYIRDDTDHEHLSYDRDTPVNNVFAVLDV